MLQFWDLLVQFSKQLCKLFVSYSVEYIVDVVITYFTIEMVTGGLGISEAYLESQNNGTVSDNSELYKKMLE